LGDGWHKVASSLTSIRGELEHADKHTILRVILLDAGLRIASSIDDPIPFLTSAERWARRQGLTQGALRLRLLWCMEQARIDPDSVPPDVLAESVKQGQQSPELQAEWRLAQATGHSDNIRLIVEALPHLTSTSHAHLKLQALQDLAEARLDGGDTPSAIHYLIDALALADAHTDLEAGLTLTSMIGQLRMVQGMPEDARPYLRRAMDLAQSENNDLALLTQASLLAGIELQASRWKEAAKAALIQIPAALRRHNWMAVADGSITLSTTALNSDAAADAIGILVRCNRSMTGQAPQGAVNLIRARLVEIRYLLGPEVFDPLLIEQAQAH